MAAACFRLFSGSSGQHGAPAAPPRGGNGAARGGGGGDPRAGGESDGGARGRAHPPVRTYEARDCRRGRAHRSGPT